MRNLLQAVFNIKPNITQKNIANEEFLTPPLTTRGLKQDVFQSIAKNAGCEEFYIDSFEKSKKEKPIKEPVKNYISSVGNSGSRAKIRKAMFSLAQQIKENKISIKDLSDEQILDIWSWRFYDGIGERNPKITEEFIERFDKICKENIIDLKKEEVLLRTIPTEFAPEDYAEFAIGKPDSVYGFWPAATARLEMSENDKIPENVLFRIKDDKIKYLMRNPGANLHDSTLFVFEQPQDKKRVIHGFDWKKTGVVNEEIANKPSNGFGSPVFRREVDDKGFSTEVVFSSDTRFKVLEDKPTETIPVELEDGRTFNVNIVHITLSDD